MTIIDIGMANLTNYRLWLQLVPVLTIIDHSDVVAPTGCTVPPWWTEMRPYLGKLCWCPKAFRARRGKQRTSEHYQNMNQVLSMKCYRWRTKSCTSWDKWSRLNVGLNMDTLFFQLYVHPRYHLTLLGCNSTVFVSGYNFKHRPGSRGWVILAHQFWCHMIH